MPAWTIDCDTVIVGGGVGGLTTATVARAAGEKVFIVDAGSGGKRARRLPQYDFAATKLAQGGISVVGLADAPKGASGTDSLEKHVADTLDAGAGLCVESAVRTVVQEGAEAVQWLIDLGARFDKDPRNPSQYLRTREGGHSEYRIIHAGGDASGAEVQRALEAMQSGVPAIQNAVVTRVLVEDGKACGVEVQDPRGRGVVRASKVVLATGGIGHLYSSTTSPIGATGSGLALALDAGAELADIEFTQFHPTVLFDPMRAGRRPLISEAVRGEGALLVDSAGQAVVTDDPRGDLAPRDVVSRAIARRLRERGESHVHLDARMIDRFAERFPTITASCAHAGIDPSADLIPVAPALHYSCGGILVDDSGRTRVPGLFAVGECARTGLHGANRLASNSLLEGLVMGRRVALAQPLEPSANFAQQYASTPAPLDVRRLNTRGLSTRVLSGQNMIALQTAMTNGVGVERDEAGMKRALEQLGALPTSGASLVAKAIATAALARTETRGCHTRTDFQQQYKHQQRSQAISLRPDGTFSIRTIEGEHDHE